LFQPSGPKDLFAADKAVVPTADSPAAHGGAASLGFTGSGAGRAGTKATPTGEELYAQVRAAQLLERDEGVLPVTIDRADLEHLLEALTSHALHAMPAGGRLLVRLFRVPADIAGGQPARAAQKIVDQGTGMDAATLARAFEPFFTTREAAAGLGLTLTRR